MVFINLKAFLMNCINILVSIGVVEGVWMIGVIDEIQTPINEATLNPILVDTKTRYKATLPSEAQKRNARYAPFPFLLLTAICLANVTIYLLCNF